VIGDMDLVRPLGIAGIRCAVVARRWEAPWCSRYVRVRIPWRDPWEQAGELIEALLAFAARQMEPPVLYYQGDPEMLVIARHHDLLSGPFRFVFPEPRLVEALADKARFAGVAEQLDLRDHARRILVHRRERDRAADRRRIVHVGHVDRHGVRVDAERRGARATCA